MFVIIKSGFNSKMSLYFFYNSFRF